MAVLAPGPESVGATLKLFGDPTRLRALALLEREELAVGELSRALGMAQSRVSNHLRLLREAGLLAERRAGTSTYVRASLGDAGALAARLWGELRGEVEATAEAQADRVRLEAVLAERDGGVFDRVAGRWDELAGRFATGQARERVVGHLLPRELVVADLGCGTGRLAAALLGRVARVIAVDASEAMLDEARERLGRAPRGTQVELRRGTLDALPLADGEADGAVLGLVLHHLPDPAAALAEVRRALRPGGTVAILELAPHGERWMQRELGDPRLGLEPGEVAEALRRAGFEDVLLDPVDDRWRPLRPERDGGGEADLELYVVRGRRPRVRTTTNPRTQPRSQDA